MKKNIFSLLIGLLLIGALVFVVQCDSSAGKVKPAIKCSFNEVTSKLIPGGHLYLYAGADRVIESVDRMAVNIRKLAEKHASKTGSQPLPVDPLKIYDLIYSMFKN